MSENNNNNSNNKNTNNDNRKEDEDATDTTSNMIRLLLTMTANQGAPRIPMFIQKDVTPTILRQCVSDHTNIPLQTLKLIFRGRLISDDNHKIASIEYKLENDTVLHCMGKPAIVVATQKQQDETTTTLHDDDAKKPSANSSAGSTVTIRSTSSTTSPSATASSANATTTNDTDDPLQNALHTLRTSNDSEQYTTAITTLVKILQNIEKNPMEEKYRQVKKHNAAFNRRLGGLVGGSQAMLACGFIDGTIDDDDNNNKTPAYIMKPTPDAWPKLVSAKAKIEAVIQLQKQKQHNSSSSSTTNNNNNNTSSSSSTTASASSSTSPNAIPEMFGGAGASSGMMVPPGMNSLLTDPNALANMLQNPMVQNMIQNDPRFANNPAMQQAIQQISNNPQMAQQMASMMGNPDMLRQIQQRMMGAAAAGGGAPGNLFAAAAAAANNNNNNNNNNQQRGVAAAGNNNNAAGSGNGGADDDQLTEEEMIAEAIRRSLQE